MDRQAIQDLVAKQVHSELLKEAPDCWAALTVSEVKRMCSKLAKVRDACATLPPPFLRSLKVKSNDIGASVHRVFFNQCLTESL